MTMMTINHREDSNGGEVTGFLSGQTVTWKRTLGNTEKNTQWSKLKAHENELEAAARARAVAQGITKNLTMTEIKNGYMKPDERTAQEKTNVGEPSGINFSGQPKTDPNQNPFANMVEHLQSKLHNANRGSERERAEDKIAHYQREANKWQGARDVVLAKEAILNTSEVQTCITCGGAWLAILETRHDVPQEWINTVKANINAVKETGDVGAYWQANDAFEATREATLNAKAATLSTQAKELNTEASAHRKDAKDLPESQG